MSGISLYRRANRRLPILMGWRGTQALLDSEEAKKGGNKHLRWILIATDSELFDKANEIMGIKTTVDHPFPVIGKGLIT